MRENLLSLLYIFLYFAAAVGLTILIETPIIVRGHMILFGIQYLRTGIAGTRLTEMLSLIWFIFGESVIVPVTEALAYRKISDAGTKRIFAFTYLANLASCAVGLVLGAVIWYLFY